MKTAAAGTVKRRSMLPAPKSFSAGASVRTSKSSEVLAKRSKATTNAVPSDVQPTSLQVDSASTTVCDSGKMSVKGHSGTESRQTQLRKPSNLQQPAVAHKRPSSASSVLNRARRELNQSSPLGMTCQIPESGNSMKPAAVMGVEASANDVDDQNADKKHDSVFRGVRSVSASQSPNGGTHQKMLRRLLDTTGGKSKVPTKYVSDDAAVMKSCLPGSEIDSSCSRSQTVLNAGDTQVQEDGDGACVLPGCASGSCVQCRSGTTVGQEFDYSESSSGSAVTVAGVVHVRSLVTSDDNEHPASSSGSLGILDDTDLLDTSLLSFDCSSAVSTVPVNEDVGSFDQNGCTPDEKTLPAVEPCWKQSPCTLENDPSLQSVTSEAGMPSVRPLSLMSNSSADMGIVADSLVSGESCCQQDRPSSYMSTSSADTGNCLLYYAPRPMVGRQSNAAIPPSLPIYLSVWG